MPDDELDVSLRNLEAYAHLLDGLPLPQCFADGLNWLLAQLPQRGYDRLTAKLRAFLDDFRKRSIMHDSAEKGTLSAMNMDAHRP